MYSHLNHKLYTYNAKALCVHTTTPRVPTSPRARSNSHRQGQQFLKVGRAETGHCMDGVSKLVRSSITINFQIYSLQAYPLRREAATRQGGPKKKRYDVPGSQPMVALNPSVPHPGLLPIVMSFNPAYPASYNHGFKKPSAGLPALIRASLSIETKEANVGEAQDVPAT